MELNSDSIQAKLLEYTKRLSGNVSLNRLFPASFVQEHSQVQDIKSLLTPEGITSQEAFDKWCDSASADVYIAHKTDFSTWKEMLNTAARQYAKRKQLMLREETWVDESFDTGVLFDDIQIFLNFSPA